MHGFFFRLTLLLFALLSLAGKAHADAWLIEVTGAIGPATSDHMVRGLEQAEAAGAEIAILRIDTPGGLDTAMRDMVKSVLASSIPVVAYVAPSGARAASAGTYLLYATHLAAMAPGTNLGKDKRISSYYHPTLNFLFRHKSASATLGKACLL